jgi:uncharacterized membrane protein
MKVLKWITGERKRERRRCDEMEWLVALHVVSAFLGIGPTFFGHVLFRKGQQAKQLRQSIGYFEMLNYFPKIGGTIAVLSGVALVAWSGWNFSDLWIVASLVLYVLIQVVAIGLLGPVVGKLMQVLGSGDDESSDLCLPLVKRANQLYNVVSLLGIVLILLMIVKPM